MSSKKVALITGRDKRIFRGRLFPRYHPHPSDVTDENALINIFSAIFSKTYRLDFVFAHAGIAEHANFFAEQESADPLLPVKGLHAIVDIKLKSVFTTADLALHYMRKNPGSDKSLVITSSCGGLYPSYYSPIYTASKHSVLGFLRTIAPYFYAKAGICVNAICPGTVKTNLPTSEEWSQFPEEYFTPIEKIGEVVEMLVDGKDDGNGILGKEVEQKDIASLLKSGGLMGRSVEVCGRKHYYREAVEYCDAGMRAIMSATNA